MRFKFYYDEFILSHHNPDEYYRCYLIKLFGKSIHVCARCLGVYSFAILSFVFYFLVNLSSSLNLVILYLFPIPAFVDWGLYRFKIWKGINPIRTLTGAFLGITYGRLGFLFVENPFNIHIYIVALSYIILAFLILRISLRIKSQ
ncbi:MAG: DUF2085 domain-containing protein [Nanoarchaeota archaeon]|nr:DUF2085 domain-containing protein [Nanoarchaeota archaeon]